jgi:hypothetical protein
LAEVAIKQTAGLWTERWVYLALAAFGLLRLLAASGDFYVDEIWSFYFARQMKSVFDVFTLNHDNNHILNTLYLYIVGGEPFFLSGKPTFIPHRLLSVTSGVVSLFLVWKIAARKGRAEAAAALLLAGLSYPLIIYSTEARGYGPEMMFALASFLLAEKYLSGSRTAVAPLFWSTAVLAFLSHSSFIFIYLGLFIWSAFEVRGRGVVAGAKRLAFLHLVPAAFLAVYYFLFLKSMVYGGGELVEPLKVAVAAASMAVGLPSEGAFGYISLAAVLLLSAAGLLGIRKASPGQAVFFLSAIFIVPALIALILKPEFLYFRYFLVCFPFFYLLAAYALAGIYRRPGWGAPVFFAVLIVFSVFNMKATLDLIRFGRGGYSEAIGYMVAESPGPDVVVGGDHDFRNGLVLGFYSGFFREKRIVYLDKEARADSVPDWLLAHSIDREYRPSEYLFDSGHRFTLKRSYGFAGVSGWSWFVYKRDAE